MEWFAVRQVIENNGSFEERITLWEAESEADAMERAEKEAAEYAATGGWRRFPCFSATGFPRRLPMAPKPSR